MALIFYDMSTVVVSSFYLLLCCCCVDIVVVIFKLSIESLPLLTVLVFITNGLMCVRERERERASPHSIKREPTRPATPLELFPVRESC